MADEVIADAEGHPLLALVQVMTAEVGLDLQTSAGWNGAMVLNSNRWGFMPRPGVPMTKAQDIMTSDVRGVNPSDRLEVAASLMKRLDVGALPPVAGDRLLGMLTDRDITVRGVGSGLARRQPVHIDPCVRAAQEPGPCHQHDLHLKDGLT